MASLRSLWVLVWTRGQPERRSKQAERTSRVGVNPETARAPRKVAGVHIHPTSGR